MLFTSERWGAGNMMGVCEKEEARVRKGKTQKLATHERQVHIALHKLMRDILKHAVFLLNISLLVRFSYISLLN